MSGCFAYHISTFLNMPENCVLIEWLRLNSNNCLEACGKNQWNEIGAMVHNGIRQYLVRCSWCSDLPSSSVSFRHSSLARVAFCCSCSKCCLLSLSSKLNFSISLGREKREKASYKIYALEFKIISFLFLPWILMWWKIIRKFRLASILWQRELTQPKLHISEDFSDRKIQPNFKNEMIKWE